MTVDGCYKRATVYRYNIKADFIIFDLETTGISCENDKIVEISALKVVNGRVVEEFSELGNPKCKIPYYSSRVNGITDDMVKDARTFDEVLPDFLGFIGDITLDSVSQVRF